MALITIASGAGHGLRYVKETVLGETPALPVMKELTYTSCTLGISRDTLTSNAIRSDRQIPFTRTGVDKISGDIAFEFGALEYDDFLEAALAGEWDNDVLQVGTKLQMFSIERASEDISQYGLMAGCAVNQMSLSIPPNALITGNFSFVGLAGDYSSSSISGTPTPSEDPVPFDSFTGLLKVDDTEIAVVTSIELSLQNGVEPKYAVFNGRKAVTVGWGKSNLSGSLSAFFTSDATLLRKFLDDAKVRLEFTLEHGDYSYDFLIPNITLTGADNPVQSEQEITLNIPWQASLDKTLGTNFQITRNLPTGP